MGYLARFKASRKDGDYRDGNYNLARTKSAIEQQLRLIDKEKKDAEKQAIDAYNRADMEKVQTLGRYASALTEQEKKLQKERNYFGIMLVHGRSAEVKNRLRADGSLDGAIAYGKILLGDMRAEGRDKEAEQLSRVVNDLDAMVYQHGDATKETEDKNEVAPVQVDEFVSRIKGLADAQKSEDGQTLDAIAAAKAKAKAGAS